MENLLEGLPTTIAGYDVAAERSRYHLIQSVEVGGVPLNRGTARVHVDRAKNSSEHARVREQHLRSVFTTTHGASSPVLELGYPSAGSYVACPAGVYLDIQLGVAQKLLCEHHPVYQQAIARLLKHGAMLRREINTDDFLAHGPATRGELHLPQELAAKLAGLANEAFPIVDGGYKVFLSNSGTEAVEAGIKVAMRVKYGRFIERYGHAVLARVMADLGIDRNEVLEAYDTGGDEPVYREYPFFLLAFQGAFHGRTLGALGATQSQRVHQLAYPKSRWLRHFTWNRAADELGPLLDTRPITEILDAPGGLRAVIAAGRIPTDLAALFVAEPFQGEGGYRVGDKAAFQALGKLLKEHGILFMLDEVQTFGRTGHVFCSAHFLNEPDIIPLAKGAFVGATLARSEFERYLARGWHSNTWGGGKLFDNEIAYVTLDALTRYKDPVLDGISYVENCRVKGAYLSMLFDRIQERLPNMLVEHSGLGLMHGVTVRHRGEVVAEAWKRGLKLLGCGPAGDAARIRILFLADCIAKELEDFAVAFADALEAVQARHLEEAVVGSERHTEAENGGMGL